MHEYEIFDIFKNDPFAFESEVAIDVNVTKGFVVITPVNNPADRKAIAFQHLFGTTDIREFIDPNDSGFRINAMGRDAVSFSTGNVLPDGTVLDGVTNGYVLLQPEILKFNFFNIDEADVISIAFRDNYEGVFGYVAEPGDAVWTPLIFDEEENPISCSPVVQNCFFDIGINDFILQANNLLGDKVLCPGNSNANGWVKIAVSGLEGLENELGLIGLVEIGEFAGAIWMHAEGAATAVVPPPECTVDADCAEGEVCEAEECVPAPECTVDADCAEGEVCEAGACVAAPPECTVDADCAEGEVCALGICIADPGGGGGCAIASTATAGSAAANALVVLIPLLGIGLRSMLRRREEN